MIRWLTLSIVLSIAAATWADDKPVTGNGKIVTESRTLAAFDRIEVRDSVDLHVTIGEATPLTVEVDENLLRLIRTEIENRKLIIYTDQPIESRHGAELAITIPKLTAISAASQADVVVEGLNTQAFAAAAQDSADVRLSGISANFSAAINDQADLNAFELETKATTVTITGPGDARISVTDTLNIAINGEGDVHYKGDPSVHQVINGAGDVHKVD